MLTLDLIFGLLVVCLILLIIHVWRGPQWLYRHEDRHDPREAAREVTDKRHAGRDSNGEQHKEI